MEPRSGLSRRRLLQLSGAGLAVSVAGCSGGSDDDGGANDGGDGNGPGDDEELSLTEYDDPTEMTLAGSGSSAFRHWLLPGFSESTQRGELICQFENFQAYPDAGENRLTQQRQVAADIFGLEAEALNWALGVGSEPQGELGWIYSGSFDQQEVGNFIEDKDRYFYIGPLEGYEIYDSEMPRAYAVGTETIIEHPSFDAFIEAEQGERERLEEADSDVGLALDVLPEGLRVGVSRRPEMTDLQVSATSYLAWEDNLPTDRIRTLVFDDAANATLDRAREIVSSAELDPANITAAEAAGRVLMFRYQPEN